MMRDRFVLYPSATVLEMVIWDIPMLVMTRKTLMWRRRRRRGMPCVMIGLDVLLCYKRYIRCVKFLCSVRRTTVVQLQ